MQSKPAKAMLSRFSIKRFFFYLTENFQRFIHFRIKTKFQQPLLLYPCYKFNRPARALSREIWKIRHYNFQLDRIKMIHRNIKSAKSQKRAISAKTRKEAYNKLPRASVAQVRLAELRRLSVMHSDPDEGGDGVGSIASELDIFSGTFKSR